MDIMPEKNTNLSFISRAIAQMAAAWNQLTATNSRHQFCAAKLIALILTIAFIFHDISWANPGLFAENRAQNNKSSGKSSEFIMNLSADKLAPKSLFQDPAGESIDKIYAVFIYREIEKKAKHAGISADMLDLKAVEAILRKHKSESWFKYAVSPDKNEILIYLPYGHILRYYYPAKTDRYKYKDRILEESPIPESEGGIHAQYLMASSLPVPDRDLQEQTVPLSPMTEAEDKIKDERALNALKHIEKMGDTLANVLSAALYFIKNDVEGAERLLKKAVTKEGHLAEEFLGEFVEAKAVEDNVKHSRIIQLGMEDFGPEIDFVLEVDRSKYASNASGNFELEDGLYLGESKTIDKNSNLEISIEQTIEDKLDKYKLVARKKRNRDNAEKGFPDVRGIIFAIGGEITQSYGVRQFSLQRMKSDEGMNILGLAQFFALIPDDVISRDKNSMRPRERVFINELIEDLLRYGKIDNSFVDSAISILMSSVIRIGVSLTQYDMNKIIKESGASIYSRASQTKDIWRKVFERLASSNVPGSGGALISHDSAIDKLFYKTSQEKIEEQQGGGESYGSKGVSADMAKPAGTAEIVKLEGDTTNPFILEHIDEGRAVEIYDKEERVVWIRRDRSNPRAPPVESHFKANGTFEKIREAKDPALLKKLLREKRNFRNLSPEEQEELIRIVRAIRLSFILGHVVIGARPAIGKRPANYIMYHTRDGFSRYKHNLEPTIWIGEILFNRLSVDRLAQSLLEEAQHILKPPKRLNKEWINLHGKIDNAVASGKDSRHVIEHDKEFIDSLDESPPSSVELAACAEFEKPESTDISKPLSTDSKILSAIDVLKARGGAINQRAIAKEAGVSDSAITRRRNANPEIDKAVEGALSLSSDLKILSAIDALSARKEAPTRSAIAEEAGISEDTITYHKKTSPKIRKAIEDAILLFKDLKIFSAIDALKARKAAITQRAIAREAGLSEKTIANRKSANPEIERAMLQLKHPAPSTDADAKKASGKLMSEEKIPGSGAVSDIGTITLNDLPFYTEDDESADIDGTEQGYVQKLQAVLQQIISASGPGILTPRVLIGVQDRGGVDSGSTRKILWKKANAIAKGAISISAKQFDLAIEQALREMSATGLKRDNVEQEEERAQCAKQLASLGYGVTRLSDARWAVDNYQVINGEMLLRKPGEMPGESIAEGGNMVYSAKDRFLIISESMSDRVKLRIRNIFKGRMKVYELPAGYFRIHAQGKKDIPARMDDHIDLSIGILEDAKLLLIDGAYLSRPDFSGKIYEIAKAEGYSVVTVDESEAYLHPANFLKLPDGRILMERVPKTIDRIRSSLPEGSTLEIIQLERSFITNLLAFGSLRCATSRLYPIVDELLKNGLGKEEISVFLAFLDEHSGEVNLDERGGVDITERGKRILANELLLRLTKKREGAKNYILEKISEEFKRLNLPKAAERVRDLLEPYSQQPASAQIEFLNSIFPEEPDTEGLTNYEKIGAYHAYMENAFIALEELEDIKIWLSRDGKAFEHSFSDWMNHLSVARTISDIGEYYRDLESDKSDKVKTIKKLETAIKTLRKDGLTVIRMLFTEAIEEAKAVPAAGTRDKPAAYVAAGPYFVNKIFIESENAARNVFVFRRGVVRMDTMLKRMQAAFEGLVQEPRSSLSSGFEFKPEPSDAAKKKKSSADARREDKEFVQTLAGYDIEAEKIYPLIAKYADPRSGDFEEELLNKLEKTGKEGFTNLSEQELNEIIELVQVYFIVYLFEPDKEIFEFFRDTTIPRLRQLSLKNYKQVIKRMFTLIVMIGEGKYTDTDIKLLLKAFVTDESIKRTEYIQKNTLPALKRIITGIIRREESKMGDDYNILGVVVKGSAAKGLATAVSDIDMVIITRERSGAFINIFLEEVQRKMTAASLPCEISVLYYEPFEEINFDSLDKKEEIAIIGASRLKKLFKERQAKKDRHSDKPEPPDMALGKNREDFAAPVFSLDKITNAIFALDGSEIVDNKNEHFVINIDKVKNNSYPILIKIRRKQDLQTIGTVELNVKGTLTGGKYILDLGFANIGMNEYKEYQGRGIFPRVLALVSRIMPPDSELHISSLEETETLKALANGVSWHKTRIGKILYRCGWKQDLISIFGRAESSTAVLLDRHGRWPEFYNPRDFMNILDEAIEDIDQTGHIEEAAIFVQLSKITRGRQRLSKPESSDMEKKKDNIFAGAFTLGRSINNSTPSIGNLIPYTHNNKGVILYADDILERAAAADLAFTVQETNIFENSTVVLYGRKPGRVELLKKIITAADINNRIRIITLTPEDLIGRNSSESINIEYHDEAKELETILRHIRSRYSINNGDMLGVIKGFTNEAYIEGVVRISKSEHMPVVSFADDNGVYSFKEAFAMLAAIKNDITPIANKEWFRWLKPIRKEEIEKAYQDYRRALEVAINA